MFHMYSCGFFSTFTSRLIYLIAEQAGGIHMNYDLFDIIKIDDLQSIVDYFYNTANIKIVLRCKNGTIIKSPNFNCDFLNILSTLNFQNITTKSGKKYKLYKSESNDCCIGIPVNKDSECIAHLYCIFSNSAKNVDIAVNSLLGIVNIINEAISHNVWNLDINSSYKQIMGLPNIILDNSNIVICIWDKDGRLIRFNKYGEKITGYKEEEVLGDKWINKLIDESENDGNIVSLIRDFKLPQLNEQILKCKNGKNAFILWSNNVVYDNDIPQMIISMGTNITVQKETEAKLSINEKRIGLLLSGINDGIWDKNLLTGEVYHSEKWKEILGYTEEEYIDNKRIWKQSIHPSDFKRVRSEYLNYLAKKIPVYKAEFRMHKKNGDYIWVYETGKAIWDADGKPIRIAGSITDITERKRHEALIYSMAYYDSLTSLPNKPMFSQYLSEFVSKFKGTGKRFALMLLDLDNFKTINDTLGHPYGDKVLITISDLLKNHISKGTVLSRFGGDEFTILIPDAGDTKTILSQAEQIIGLFKNPLLVNSQEIYITPSIGISIFPDDSSDESSLIKNADTAMYHAKSLGKNSCQLYAKEMNEKMSERLTLEKDLRYAIKNKEFIVYYQPQIDIAKGELVGMEALVRWVHPVKGLIPPIKFIPIAEESTLIVAIGEQVLYEACLQNQKWQDAGYKKIPVAVNLSARQFQQLDLCEKIKSILNSTGLSPKYLEIEITESIAMKDLDTTIRLLNELRSIGVKVSLDDFGTGYSSLNYLKKLPINNLKIDKSFVDEITTLKAEKVIAKAVIVLAHDLNLTVIAEGVETPEQLSFLKFQDCDKAQGYLFSKPIPADKFEELLKKQK